VRHKLDENIGRRGLNQVSTDERRVLIAALIEGERSGVSARRVPDIVAAIKQKMHSTLNE
jgi:hypothetical protein